MSLSIVPRSGAGPVRLEMTQEQVRAALGPPEETLVRNEFSRGIEWLYKSRGIFIGFDAEGLCAEVTLLPESNPMLGDVEILRVGASAAWVALRRKDKGAMVSEETLVSRDQGIAIWAPHLDEDPTEPASNVMVFRAGYFDPVYYSMALSDIAAEQPYPLLFSTVSGAHLYGFPSEDSDWDLRGVHILPAKEVVGLDHGPDTLEVHRITKGLDLDLVTHDVAKFFGLMLRRNGYVLEQIHSPLVALTTPEHEELKTLARACVTRHHAHHYRGFFGTEWGLFRKQSPRQVKPLLYCYRVLLTGIHLMRTGEIESNLPQLLDEYPREGVPELIARKAEGGEKGTLDDSTVAFHESRVEKTLVDFEEAAAASRLPEEPTARAGLHDLLIRVRLIGPCSS